MAKHVAAFVGILAILIPWLFSAYAVFEFGELATDVQTNSIEPGIAKSKLTTILYQYLYAGLSAMIGLIALGFCVDGFQYRPKWMFWAIMILGLIWLPFYAAGTMLGIALILYASFNYPRFHKNETAT